jgi:hypothetical protein
MINLKAAVGTVNEMELWILMDMKYEWMDGQTDGQGDCNIAIICIFMYVVHNQNPWKKKKN